MQSSPNMLTKFESKSSRAKGIAFHPKRPWILVSLHSSTIQLWDYRMGTLIDRFEEHDGPVRGIDFHKTQPLFVSGGDDYKIKVWSYQTRRCLFTLNGHLDYVRTVVFHHELPWILSSSDDQTIRIWNWQNRSLICTMTGHNHYTMCAQFHPKEDLIVSASLDQSVRVWDISGLRKKHSAPTSMTFEDQMSRANPNQADMFGNTDAVVKFVLEGHDRGVNWVAFHPTLPLIVSAGDDRLVKLWRMSDTKAWEVDTCRGHFQNASACLFHPHQDLILSVGEDKTIRVWDLNKRTSVQSFKRENDRFWVIAAHPEINLFAAGHDNGVMVFKLERERPASAVHQNQLFFISKEKHVRSYDFQKNLESPSMLSLKKLGSPWVPPRTLSYNPAERAILVTSSADSGIYELISLPRDASGAVEPTDMKRGQGNSAIFVARNRFAVFNQAIQQIDIKDLSNSTTKTIKPPPGTVDIYFGGTGCLLIITPTSVILYDIQQKKNIAELAVNGVKYVVWSNDGLYAALLSKHNVMIVTKALEQVSTLHETIRIKSATWDDAGVLLYSTLNHIKYTLLNGDNGIVRTLGQTVYLVRVKAQSVYCLDRAAKPKVLTIDPTEYRFKLALVKRNYEEMLQIIKTSSLVGQSIISYLQKKGYPEIALQFVQDPQTRFELAIECGNLDVAVDMAKQLDRPKLWARLGTEALAQGNHQTVEMSYQKLRSFDKLSFLYLATGDKEKLARMAKIAEHRGDFTARFQNSLYLGDIEDRIQMFKEVDQYPLAYLTAKSNGLTEECEAILEASGLTEDQLSVPSMGTPLRPPKPIVPTFQSNWPVKAASHSFFEKALLDQVEGLSLEDGTDPASNSLGFKEAADGDGAGGKRNGHLEEEEEEEAAGWDMGDDVGVEADSDFVNAESAETGSGSSEAELWARNSPLAADHVAGGSFDTAMQLLNRQVGAVNFKPLKPRFLEIYQSSKTYLPASAGLPPLVNYVRRTVDEVDSRKILPIIPRDLESIASGELQSGYSAMRHNNLEEGVKIFKRILHTLLVNAVSTKQELEEATKIISTATEYIIAMSIELERRRLADQGPANLKRILELSAYFTIPKLELAHRQLALVSAMNLAYKNKNLASALGFANRILANGGPSNKMLENARRMKAICERDPHDVIDIEFDQFAEFDICAASYTPIYRGSRVETCPYTGAMYHAKYKGTVCTIIKKLPPVSGRREPFPPHCSNLLENVQEYMTRSGIISNLILWLKMRVPALVWGLAGTLLFSTPLLVQCSSASPAVTVELKASFNSPPYLVELLETAAEENETSYFPLLDRIAEGYFSKAKTDEELYNAFLQLLQEDRHITDAETLSSFQFALSIHSSAPRIEAHYQFYNTSVVPSLGTTYDPECPVWHQIHGLQHCEPGIPYAPDTSNKITIKNLPFDRILGNPLQELGSHIILYADINSPSFGDIYMSMAHKAKEGSINYRVRYRPSTVSSGQHLTVAGYGVELALKRTDYIVIDDRDAEKPEKEKENGSPANTEAGFNEEEIADLKPLSMTELAQLGLKASSFILSSGDPFGSLIRLVQDFPKHSSAIAAHNITQNFLTELRGNRELQLPGGLNALWINGVQLDNRQIDAFTLLEHLRHERKLVNALKDLGLSGKESVKILSYPTVAESKLSDEPQRYDFRDEIEGGNIIIWMNDIEKDKRYRDWSGSLETLLQRVYPGSLPPARRDIHNLVIPLDFSDLADIELVVETLQTFVHRKIPVRFGLVPLLKSESSKQQAKVAYHLLDTYGISAVLVHLEAILKGRKLPFPDESSFASAVKDRKLRKGSTALALKNVLLSEELDKRLGSAGRYINRLGAASKVPPIFINGVALPRDEEWLGAMTTRISIDHRTIQRGIVEYIFEEDTWIPGFFLSQSMAQRNSLIIPEDENSVQILDIGKSILENGELYLNLPKIAIGPESVKENWAHMVVIGDFDVEGGHQLLHEAIQARKEDLDIELVLLHNPQDSRNTPTLSAVLRGLQHVDYFDSPNKFEELLKTTTPPVSPGEGSADGSEFWNSAQAFAKDLGFSAGQKGLVVNGRVIGPIPETLNFGRDDFKQLLEYERAKRSRPAFVATSALGISNKLDCPLTAATLSSLVALSTMSDVPEGIFESPSTLRTTAFEQWDDTYTTIQTGNSDTAVIQIVVIVDPASELAQRWVPILKVLSEINGVHLKLFLNPREILQELPVKRFYRYILDARPAFEEDGSLRRSQARFTGIPGEALLTVGLDVPPSWLVAPKECIYDLDNIKLNSLKDRLRGSGVEAVYELEHILIEGHSREAGTGQAPRGAQLVLGTEKTPHHADTIVMANLGYFQFKANPGYWKISLEKGRSQEIFNIDSAGTKGYRPKSGDESPEIELMSFQGKTLFPRLSRKPGRENDDVLEDKPTSGSAMDYLLKGLKLAEDMLSSVGLSKRKQNADINIFSVASGHLYERMLNIMMVSVMKHTEHSVKFWFIEQFLSPSFKDFIPVLSEQYGFDYEMVTYKWPHWLRGQKEKQREIWGYKILFLDVLFPLSLDKVIFVDADQIVRTDMYELVSLDLNGAPYGFTPMCDSRAEMEGFRFWKQGYWKNFLRGLPYHISALYVVDLKRFRQIAAGDRLRQQYHTLSADPNSLSNLDQDLPNHMQVQLPIYSLPQNWLWCETWCSDESLKDAKTIDLCNNPMTKEPKLDRARRQVPEWNEYDNEIAALGKRRKGLENNGQAPVEQESSIPVTAGREETEAARNTKSRSLDENEGRKKDEL